MNILYIGGGFVGACSAVISADSGHQTLVFDIDENKVKKLSTNDRDVIQSVIHEDGLAELLIRNRTRIEFTIDQNKLADFVNQADAIYMCLPTPEKKEGGGESDLSYYVRAVEMLGPMLAGRNNGKQSKRVVIVNKSTVPIKMITYTKELFEKRGVNNFGIVSNPEFLVEGKAIEGTIHPDRVVVGAETKEDFGLMRQIYQRFYNAPGIQYLEVNPQEAEAGKLLANFLLFNKVVTTYDVVGRAAEYFDNINYEQLRKVLTSDPRIGTWGLYDSLHSGGSCFIKDAGSLAYQLEQAGTKANLVRGILEANNFQLNHFFKRAEEEVKFEWAGKTITVLGLSFKQATNDMRNSGAVGFIQQLLGSGVKEIKAYDPVANEDAKKWYFDPSKNDLYNKISYFNSEKEAIKDSDALVICTDWPQFKEVAGLIKDTVKPSYLIMDGRRSLSAHYNDLQQSGFDIIAVGSPFIKGK